MQLRGWIAVNGEMVELRSLSGGRDCQDNPAFYLEPTNGGHISLWCTILDAAEDVLVSCIYTP